MYNIWCFDYRESAINQMWEICEGFPLTTLIHPHQHPACNESLRTPFISTTWHDCNIHLSIESELHHLLIQLDIIALFIHLIWGHYSWKTCFYLGNIKATPEWLGSATHVAVFRESTLSLSLAPLEGFRMKLSKPVWINFFYLKMPIICRDEAFTSRHQWAPSLLFRTFHQFFTQAERWRLIHFQLCRVLWYSHCGFFAVDLCSLNHSAIFFFTQEKGSSASFALFSWF